MLQLHLIKMLLMVHLVVKNSLWLLCKVFAMMSYKGAITGAHRLRNVDSPTGDRLIDVPSVA